MKSNPLTFAAVSAGVALTFGTIAAQDRSVPGDTMNRDAQQRSGQKMDADDYSVLVWDPITGAWAYIADVETGKQAQEKKDHTAKNKQTARRSGDRWPDDQGWSATMEGTEAADRQDMGKEARDKSKLSRLQGTIDGFRKVTVRRGEDMPEKHAWIRLRLKDGSTKVVDLGRHKDLAELELEKGERVRVAGRKGTISGQQTLLADTIRVGNETYNIDRKTKRQQVTGTISDYEYVRLKDSDRADHLVVHLVLENGEEVTADLGRSGSLSELGLQRDKPVKLEGKRRQINGRSILVVKKITHMGEQQQWD